ncbi:MAG TPA: DNA gyrase inhibitor YacG [Geobacteraceae bacterium]
MNNIDSCKSHHCPVCRKMTVWTDNPSRPFCSERCRLIDLGRWANEEYRIPAEKQAEHPDEMDE